MMTDELRLNEIGEQGENFGSFNLDFYGQGDHFYVTVAKPTDEYSGGVCLPYFLGAFADQKKWYMESGYTSIEFGLPEKEKAERIKIFLAMGLPLILTVYAAYGDFDPEEVRDNLPNRKASVIGLGAYYSGRGKTMLGAIISHLCPDVEVVSAEVFSSNDVKKYREVIADLHADEDTFDFDVAVEKMKETAKEDKEPGGGTIKMVMERIWKAWFENEDKEIILVDLPGRSELANYPANSFGLLRYGMSAFEVIREYENGEGVSASVEIETGVIKSYFEDFRSKRGGILMESKLLDREFKMAIDAGLRQEVPARLVQNSREMRKI